MQRNMDFVRDLLLEVEGGRWSFETLDNSSAEMLGITPANAMTKEESSRLRGHLDLLEQAGFLTFEAQSGDGTYIGPTLTWQGHDFLDAVREPKVWHQTKDRAAKVGGWTVGILVEIAKGVIKGELAKQGVPLG